MEQDKSRRQARTIFFGENIRGKRQARTFFFDEKNRGKQYFMDAKLEQSFSMKLLGEKQYLMDAKHDHFLWKQGKTNFS